MPSGKRNRKIGTNGQRANAANQEALRPPRLTAWMTAGLVAGALAAMTTPLAAQPQPAATQAQRIGFDQPAQPLLAALKAFGRQTQSQVLYNESQLAGLQAPALKGSFTPREAIDRLLAGTGLVADSNEPGTFTLKKRPASPTETSLAPVVVTAQAERDGRTEGTGTYTANAVTIGKTPLALKDTPQSIAVVSRQQIEEQNLVGVDDALRQATGVTLEQWYGDAVEIKSRGFGVTNFRYDGGGVTEQGSRSYTFLPDLIGFDHVEVLRGADSLSAGAGVPGGSVNLVRKRPTAEPQLLWNASLGSWNFKRAEIDVSRPLNEAGSVRGRLAAAAQDRDYFYDNANAAKQVVYGVVEADLAPGSVLSGGITYEHMRAKPWLGSGIPRYADGGLLDVPRSTSYVYDWNRRDTDTQEAFVRWEHALSGDWKLNLNANYRHEATVGYVAAPGGGNIVERETGLGRAILDVFDEDFYAKQLSIDANASGTVDWGGRRHHLLAGLDWMDYRLHYEAASDFGVADVNFLRFDPGSFPYPSMPQFPANSWSPWIYDYDKLGAYASGRFEVADGTHLIVGGRLNNIDGSEKIDRRVLTPYSGLTYALDARHTIYASVSDVFESQNNYLDAAMQPLDPMTGRNHEIGAKGEWWNGRLNGSVALYQMERTGQAFKVPGTQSPCCYVARGTVISKGVDLELSGALTPRWNLTAGYTFNRNVNKQDDLPFDSVTPRHLFKLWTAYQLPDTLSAWKIGGGLVSQSSFKSYGFELPGYTAVSAFAEYRINPMLSVSLNIGNLFDRSYYQTGGWYGEPRNVMVSLRGRF